MLIRPDTETTTEGTGGATATGTAPKAGTLTVASAEARCLLLTLTAGEGDPTPSRTVALYTDAAMTALVPGYPRAVAPDGATVYSWRADGINPSTKYYVKAAWTNAGGSATATAEGTTSAETGGAPASLANPVLVVDERDAGTAYPLELPASPVILSVGQVDASTSTFQKTLAPPSDAPIGTGGSLGTGWTVSGGGFGTAEWADYPSGASMSIHIDTTSALAAGDKVYFTESATVDLSGVGRIVIEGYSAPRENRTGTFLAFVWSEDAGSPTTWHEAPFAVTKAGQSVLCEADLSVFADADRNAVKHWGIASTTNEAFVFYWKAAKAGKGIYGRRDYKAVDRKRWGSATSTAEVYLQLDSQESPVAEVGAGAKGVVNTLTFTAVPSGCTRLVYGRDTDTDDQSFHYVGTAAEGATTFADDRLDIGQDETLIEGRAQVPHAGDDIGVHHRRLGIVKGRDLWFSAPGDLGYWRDSYIDEASDAGLSPNDPVILPLSGVEKVVGLCPLGVYTGADYLGDTLILTPGEAIRLTGTDISNFSVGFRLPGGAAGVNAWAKGPDGKVYTLTPEGNVLAYDRGLSAQDVGEPIAPELWKLSAAKLAAGVVGSHPQRDRIAVCVDGNLWAYDVKRGGWVTAEGAEGATCAATGFAGEGSYLVLGTEAGWSVRPFDPDADPSPWAWKSSEWNGTQNGAPGASYQCTGLSLEGEGTVAATLYCDGVAMDTLVVPLRGDWKVWRFGPSATGRRFALELEGDGDTWVTAARLIFTPRGF